MRNPIPARYQAATVHAGGRCPIEAGLLGRLADHECAHGRLPADPSTKCGCWPQENAAVIPLPNPTRTHPRPEQRAA
jgi:hypothetical protein